MTDTVLLPGAACKPVTLFVNVDVISADIRSLKPSCCPYAPCRFQQLYNVVLLLFAGGLGCSIGEDIFSSLCR